MVYRLSLMADACTVLGSPWTLKYTSPKLGRLEDAKRPIDRTTVFRCVSAVPSVGVVSVQAASYRSSLVRSLLVDPSDVVNE